jgi:autotransporter strand-loop-strand O-heptosyltransferase
MENKIKVSYVTTLPKEGNAPRVTIIGNTPQKYKVMFYEVLNDKSGIKLINWGLCMNNHTILGKVKQWFTTWLIRVFDESDDLVFEDRFNPNGKVVFIKMDAYALGDSIAWIPYVDLFRKKHSCEVICSTFHNHLFVDSYPDIMFIKPDSVIENIYAQYYIGASNEDNPYYSPIMVNRHPLQHIAATTLGLGLEEVRPSLRDAYLHLPSKMTSKYVTLSEFGSTPIKHWGIDNGWQLVVDFLKEKGYNVLVISKEKTNLTGVIDYSGNYKLTDRIVDILHADFHMGVSSGLSWLSWGLGTHTVMISDVTPNWHEFQSNITRLNANNLSEINYHPDNKTSVSEVLKKLEELVV